MMCALCQEPTEHLAGRYFFRVFCQKVPQLKIHALCSLAHTHSQSQSQSHSHTNPHTPFFFFFPSSFIAFYFHLHLWPKKLPGWPAAPMAWC